MLRLNFFNLDLVLPSVVGAVGLSHKSLVWTVEVLQEEMLRIRRPHEAIDKSAFTLELVELSVNALLSPQELEIDGDEAGLGRHQSGLSLHIEEVTFHLLTC